MTSPAQLSLGVIEGFYGVAWDASTRLAVPGWLAGIGLDTYMYAPKSDAYLRKRWNAPWPSDHYRHLEQLARCCEESRIDLIIGISPFELWADYGARSRQAFRSRIDSLLDLGIAGVALLFDDMPGGRPDLAERQLPLCEDLKQWCGALQTLVCPTYYSDDPVLDDVFGARPADYLATLGDGLPDSMSLFWTGPKVCSEAIHAADMAPLAQQLKTPPTLWDNYPVNDSRLRSEHLYLQPLCDRDPALQSCLAGHWCNAMNQAALSLPALHSLAKLYGRAADSARAVFEAAGLSEDLIAACQPLAASSRDEIDVARSAALRRAAAGQSPAARELRDWLAGRYVFDPACLTD